jgi:hypothetical protein
MLKINKKYATVLFVTLMVIAMSFIISLTLTIIKSGFTDGFLTIWLRNWALSAIVAWPTAMIVVPAVRKIVANLTA